MVFLYWRGLYLVSTPRNHFYIVLFCFYCGSSGRFPQLRHAVRIKRHIHAASQLPASCEGQILDPLEVSRVSERWSEDKFANLWWGVAIGSWLPGYCYNALPSNSGSMTLVNSGNNNTATYRRSHTYPTNHVCRDLSTAYGSGGRTEGNTIKITAAPPRDKRPTCCKQLGSPWRCVYLTLRTSLEEAANVRGGIQSCDGAMRDLVRRSKEQWEFIGFQYSRTKDVLIFRIGIEAGKALVDAVLDSGFVDYLPKPSDTLKFS